MQNRAARILRISGLMTSLEREGLPLSARRPRPLPPSGRAAQYQRVKGQCRGSKASEGVWAGRWGGLGAAEGIVMRDSCCRASDLGRRTRGLCFPLLCSTLSLYKLEKGDPSSSKLSF